jgi:hypothetical protein
VCDLDELVLAQEQQIPQLVEESCSPPLVDGNVDESSSEHTHTLDFPELADRSLTDEPMEISASKATDGVSNELNLPHLETGSHYVPSRLNMSESTEISSDMHRTAAGYDMRSNPKPNQRYILAASRSRETPVPARWIFHCHGLADIHW